MTGRSGAKAGARLSIVKVLALNERIGTLPTDVAHKLLDYELLVGDDRLDDIADGDESNEFAVIDDGKMAGAFLGHQ